MAYTVRVRGVEIICETLDDVGAIIERYGSGEEGVGRSLPGAGALNGGGPPRLNRGGDMALLRSFVEAGSAGITSEIIGQMLSARGKGMPPALERWAERIGLKHSGATLPLEAARPQGARGWRLNEGGMVMARELLG